MTHENKKQRAIIEKNNGDELKVKPEWDPLEISFPLSPIERSILFIIYGMYVQVMPSKNIKLKRKRQ